ncbi:hypothetical protein EVC17_072 [Rhizobium phage RHph_Y1_1]|nr:hypothetical protein EVB80_072 [Rhizobium phage RHph_I36]QIG75429.1 hypothetical protein EVC17_072 [Rhizobium phage RHph_Y1_1]QIG75979.1 hypothetical protein EVC21_072 [Rhizobium phage RHph_Y2_17_2]
MRKLYLSTAALLAGVCFSAEGAGAAAAPAPVTETKTVLKQNGIKRPDAGSITGKLWDIADAISESLGRPAPRKDVVDRYLAEVPNANAATANTQYARWVSYHGVADILRKARAEETSARQAEKVKATEAAKAEKEAKKKAEADAKAEKAAERERKAAEAKAAKEKKAEEAKAAKEAKAAEAAVAKKTADEAAAKANTAS